MLDRKGVGENLQRPSAGSPDLPVHQAHHHQRRAALADRPPAHRDRMATGTGTGPLATGINQGGLFTRVLPKSQSPDIQFHVATLSADMAGGKVHDFSGFAFSVCQLRPESTGSITLGSSDPFGRRRSRQLSGDREGSALHHRRYGVRAQTCRNAALVGLRCRRGVAGPGLHHRRRSSRLRAAERRHNLHPVPGTVPDGLRRRGRGRSAPAGPRHRRPVGRRSPI